MLNNALKTQPVEELRRILETGVFGHFKDFNLDRVDSAALVGNHFVTTLEMALRRPEIDRSTDKQLISLLAKLPPASIDDLANRPVSEAIYRLLIRNLKSLALCTFYNDFSATTTMAPGWTPYEMYLSIKQNISNFSIDIPLSIDMETQLRDCEVVHKNEPSRTKPAMHLKAKELDPSSISFSLAIPFVVNPAVNSFNITPELWPLSVYIDAEQKLIEEHIKAGNPEQARLMGSILVEYIDYAARTMYQRTYFIGRSLLLISEACEGEHKKELLQMAVSELIVFCDPYSPDLCAAYTKLWQLWKGKDDDKANSLLSLKYIAHDTLRVLGSPSMPSVQRLNLEELQEPYLKLAQAYRSKAVQDALDFISPAILELCAEHLEGSLLPKKLPDK